MNGQVKTLALRVKAAQAVDDATLALINQFTLRPFTADELQVREYVLAHNCIDRDNECFHEDLLEDFMRTLVDKGVHIIHPTSYRGSGGPAEGKVFATSTETMSLDEGRTLMRDPTLQLPPDRSMVMVMRAKAYFARTDENGALLLKQDAGIAGDVSVGFTAAGTVPIKDAQGNELTARRWVGPGSADEMSLVWLGAQQGARAVKAAKTPTEPEPKPERKTMDLTNEQIAELQSKASGGEKATSTLAAIKTALGADAPLLDNPAQLKAHVDEAKAYKAALIDDIVATERQLKITGDTDEAVRDAKAFLAELPVERLKAMQKGLEARLPPQAQIKGAQPTGSGPGSEQVPADSPMSNPALSA